MTPAGPQLSQFSSLGLLLEIYFFISLLIILILAMEGVLSKQLRVLFSFQFS